MAASANTRHTTQKQGSSSANARKESLQQHLEARSKSSNDCEWMYALLCSAASPENVDPICHVRLHYQDREDSAAISTKDFMSGNLAASDLEKWLDSTRLRAVTVCHRDSSRVDPTVLNLLWNRFKIDMSFMRHHFDYYNFRYEDYCPKMIRSHLEHEMEVEQDEDEWTFGGRWNPIRLPSETKASILRLAVDSECLSICHRDGIDAVITLVRSLGVYRMTSSSERMKIPQHTKSFPSSVDLYNTTTTMPSENHLYLNDPTELSHSIVHFYVRLLILRCYEDYALRHDPEPIDLSWSERFHAEGLKHIEAMHRRRLEIDNMKQALRGYLGFSAHECKTVSNSEDISTAENSYWQKFHGLLNDLDSLLSLYDHSMRIYEWRIRVTESEGRRELLEGQLAESRESKATAVSLGKLSNVAFLYLPLNSVCALLGMNLAIFGQGTVPMWTFFLLVFIFGLMTYLPILLSLLFNIDPERSRYNKLAYHLAWRSPLAAFWFLAFTFTHDDGQNFSIIHSGLSQVLLGYSVAETKGWTDATDNYFDSATWGSKAFWKEKIKMIFRAVKELDVNEEPTELTV